jgi:hypothetical protein
VNTAVRFPLAFFSNLFEAMSKEVAPAGTSCDEDLVKLLGRLGHHAGSESEQGAASGRHRAGPGSEQRAASAAPEPVRRGGATGEEEASDLTRLLAHIQRLKDFDSKASGALEQPCKSGPAVHLAASPSPPAKSRDGSPPAVAQDRQQVDMERYAAFLQNHRRLRKQQRLPDGPLAAAVLSSPERHGQSEALLSTSPCTAQAMGITATPKEFQSFLTRHKEKRRKFKASVSSVSLKANESILESPAEGLGDPGSEHCPIPRTLSETKLGSEESGSSILYRPEGSDAESARSSWEVPSVCSREDSQSPRSPLEVHTQTTSPCSRASSTSVSLGSLMQDTASLIARLRAVQASDVSGLLQETNALNAEAAVSASELGSAEQEAHEATAPASSEGKAQATGTPTKSTSNKPCSIERSISVNTQAQLDTLVTEVGALLTRLLSADACGISELLDNISGDSMLAAIVSARLGQHMPASTGGASMSASVEEAAVSQQCAIRGEVPEGFTDTASPVVSERLRDSILKRSSSRVLKKSVSFDSLEKVEIPFEETASLTRVSSTEPGTVPEMLQDVSDLNPIACLLVSELGSAKKTASTLVEAVSLRVEDVQLDATRNEDAMDGFKDFAAATRRKSQGDCVTNVLEEMNSRNTEAASVLEPQHLTNMLLDPGRSNVVGSILSMELTSPSQKDGAKSQEDDSGSAGVVPAAHNVLRRLQETQGPGPGQHTDGGDDVTIETNSVRRQLSISTQQDLDDLVQESNTLLDRLASSDTATVSEMLLELSRCENALAQMLVDTTPKLKKGNSLVDVLRFLKEEGAAVETKLGELGSFVVSERDDQDEVSGSAQDFLDFGDGKSSSMTQLLSSSQDQRTESTTTTVFPSALEVDCSLSTNLSLFTGCEYESEDDASEDGGEELKRMLLTRKRDILVQGLKVLHMVTLNLQSDFFLLWFSQIPRRCASENSDGVDAPADASQKSTGEEEKPGQNDGGATVAEVATRIQEPNIVLVEDLPEHLLAIWPDLDLDSYRAGTRT